MKKLISFLCVSLFLCGCSGSKVNITPVVNSISFTASIAYYNECFECDVVVDKDGKMMASVTVPEELCGLNVTYYDDQCTSDYKGLSYTAKIGSTPLGCVCNSIYAVLKDISGGEEITQKDGDSLFINGNTGNIEYKLFIASTGLPLSLEIPDKSFNVEFSKVTILR